jgi:hypothetical protein
MKEGRSMLPIPPLHLPLNMHQRIQSTCMQPSRRPAEASTFRYPFGGMNGQSSR